jgi:hypothetical protein
MFKAWVLIVSLCLQDGACWSVVADFDTQSECETFQLRWAADAHAKAPDKPFLYGCVTDEEADFVMDARDIRDKLIEAAASRFFTGG